MTREHLARHDSTEERRTILEVVQLTYASGVNEEAIPGPMHEPEVLSGDIALADQF